MQTGLKKLINMLRIILTATLLFSGCVFQVNNPSLGTQLTTVTLPFCSRYTQTVGAPFQSGLSPTPDGTVNRPYHICTAAQLNTFLTTAGLWTANVTLEADLDLSTVTSMLGTANCGAYFTGNFNGNNKILSNYTCNVANTCSTAATDYVALFKCVGGDGNDDGTNDGIVKNLTLKNFVIEGRDYVGTLAGSTLSNARFTNITVSGTNTVSGRNAVGGIFGRDNGISVMSSLSSTAAVSGTTQVGGVSGLVSSSSSYTNVTHSSGLVSASGNSVGGLIGEAQTTTVLTTCTNSSNVTNTGAGDYIGGLVGLRSEIVSSSSSGTITGGTGSAMGGLCGNCATITSSSSTATLLGATMALRVGGLVGQLTGAVTNSNFTGALTGGQFSGGIAGQSSAGATVTNSWVTGTLNVGAHSGGLIGIGDAVITDSYFHGSLLGGSNNIGGIMGSTGAATTLTRVHANVTIVASAYQLGGIAGQFSGTANDSYATGSVTSTGGAQVGGFAGTSSGNFTGNWAQVNTSSGDQVGGFVGDSSAGTFSRNFTRSATVSSGNWTGGFIGHNHGATINDCYSISTTINSSTNHAGGFVGLSASGTIATSYAAATSVTAGNAATAGGFTGQHTGGTYTNNYWDQTLNPTLGDVGTAGNVANITAMATAAMYVAGNFTGWTFGAIWTSSGADYPRLGFE